MKQVYIFNEESNAAVYGIGTYIDQLLDCLQQISDISLNIILLHSKSVEFSVERKQGHIVYHLSGYDTLGVNRKKYFRNLWYLFLANVPVCSNEQLIFHLNFSFEYSLVDFMRASYPECKILFTVHSQDWCFRLQGDVDFLRRILVETSLHFDLSEEKKELVDNFEKEKHLYQIVDKVICLSQFTKKLLLEDYQIQDKKLFYCSNGVKDAGGTCSEEDKMILKQKFCFSENDKIILFVGRLDGAKGADVLVDAFKRIVEVIPDCRLVVIGAGDYSLCTKRGYPCWNKITFTGFLDKESLYQFYKIADVGVNLSMYEQCSYVTIEMMMFGLPIIHTAAPGLDEMIPHEELKVKIEYRDCKVSVSAKECADKIIQVLQMPKSYCLDSRTMYLAQYTQELMKTRLIRLYDFI